MKYLHSRYYLVSISYYICIIFLKKNHEKNLLNYLNVDSFYWIQL